MARYKAIIAYDGTDYQGWQVQPNQKAIANVLQNTFRAVFEHSIKIIGASRTDAGVHALGQVAAFDCDIALSSEKLQTIWNAHLPMAISIRSLDVVSPSFHPQRNVVQKTYWYHLFLSDPLAFVARYGYQYPYSFDQKKLYDCLQVFVGTHDFRSFCKGYEQESTVRTIDAIAIETVTHCDGLRIVVTGQSFLYFMIRRIIGACLEVASRNILSIEHLQRVLEEKDPEQTLPNAPARGLLLATIDYEEPHD